MQFTVFLCQYLNHIISLQNPNEQDRTEMLDGLLQNVNYSGDLSGQYLAQRTAVSVKMTKTCKTDGFFFFFFLFRLSLINNISITIQGHRHSNKVSHGNY